MSNPGLSKLKTLSLTGNDTIDAAIRYGLVALFGILTGAIVGFLNAHGFHDPNLTIYMGGGVGTFLIAAATSIWGIVKASKNKWIVQLREALGVQAGIAAAEAEAPTPQINSVADAQKVIADHAPPANLPAR